MIGAASTALSSLLTGQSGAGSSGARNDGMAGFDAMVASLGGSGEADGVAPLQATPDIPVPVIDGQAGDALNVAMMPADGALAMPGISVDAISARFDARSATAIVSAGSLPVGGVAVNDADAEVSAETPGTAEWPVAARILAMAMQAGRAFAGHGRVPAGQGEVSASAADATGPASATSESDSDGTGRVQVDPDGTSVAANVSASIPLGLPAQSSIALSTANPDAAGQSARPVAVSIALPGTPQQLAATSLSQPDGATGENGMVADAAASGSAGTGGKAGEAIAALIAGEPLAESVVPAALHGMHGSRATLAHGGAAPIAPSAVGDSQAVPGTAPEQAAAGHGAVEQGDIKAPADMPDASAPSATPAQPAPVTIHSAQAASPLLPALDAVTTPATSIEQVVMGHHLDLARDGAWLDQLARDIVSTAGGDAKLQFKLNPQNLGSLYVELIRQDDGAAVRMTTENEAARAVLADAQGRLVAEARAHGMRITETTVDVGRNGGGDSGQRGWAEAGTGQHNSQSQHRHVNGSVTMNGVSVDRTEASAARRERYA